ncbi:MAG: UPF0149 family protein [Magnetovibrio sp.]|nr:UPF0149 family protein [Magnetovibrio sp.]
MDNGLSNYLELLDGFLGSDAVNDDAMSLSELDGYLAGMIVCPASVLPREWMGQVWGKGGLSLDSIEKVDAVNGLVMARYTAIISMLDQGGGYHPVYDVDAQENVVWPVWTGGFLRAMSLHQDTWHMFGETQSEDVQQAIFMMMRMCELGSMPEDELEPMDTDEQLISIAPDLIPQAVQLLFDAKRAQGTALPMSLDDTELKIGRNDPCPCGSGQKYKKCCLN